MRLIVLLLAFGHWANAQATLVQTAPNETWDLACPTCTIAVTDIALVRGHQVMPFNIRKSPPANLLHWRYFDKFLNRMATYPRPLYGEDCTQIIDDLAGSDTVSLHINLSWTTDSSGLTNKMFLLIGGLQKRDLTRFPIECAYSDEVLSGQRFAAIAQVARLEGGNETYEITEGTITIDLFDLKRDKISGSFDFWSDRAGVVKKGIFKNGRFLRE